MSLLWKGKRKPNPLTISKRPSPRHNKNIPCFAQSKIPYENNNPPVYSNFFLHKICRFIKGISLLTSSGKKMEGSMTVEASIVLPLFFFFFLNIGGAIEMIRLHGNLELALWEVGNRLSVYGHVLTEKHELTEEEVPDGEESLWWKGAAVALASTYVKGQIIDYLGEDYLESSPLKEGTDSLLFLESDVRESEDTFEVVVTYPVSPIGSLIGFRSFRMANKYYGHFWIGYEIPAMEEAQEAYVYVTENGEVYHVTGECTHLKLSVRQASFSWALNNRNDNGEKYEACEKCGDGNVAGLVYITSEGNRYHFERDCPGLKRTVYYVPISQVPDFEICSRCAAQGKP